MKQSQSVKSLNQHKLHRGAPQQYNYQKQINVLSEMTSQASQAQKRITEDKQAVSPQSFNSMFQLKQNSQSTHSLSQNSSIIGHSRPNAQQNITKDQVNPKSSNPSQKYKNYSNQSMGYSLTGSSQSQQLNNTQPKTVAALSAIGAQFNRAMNRSPSNPKSSSNGGLSSRSVQNHTQVNNTSMQSPLSMFSSPRGSLPSGQSHDPKARSPQRPIKATQISSIPHPTNPKNNQHTPGTSIASSSSSKQQSRIRKGIKDEPVEFGVAAVFSELERYKEEQLMKERALHSKIEDQERSFTRIISIITDKQQENEKVWELYIKSAVNQMNQMKQQISTLQSQVYTLERENEDLKDEIILSNKPQTSIVDFKHSDVYQMNHLQNTNATPEYNPFSDHTSSIGSQQYSRSENQKSKLDGHFFKRIKNSISNKSSNSTGQVHPKKPKNKVQTYQHNDNKTPTSNGNHTNSLLHTQQMCFSDANQHTEEKQTGLLGEEIIDQVHITIRKPISHKVPDFYDTKFSFANKTPIQTPPKSHRRVQSTETDQNNSPAASISSQQNLEKNLESISISQDHKSPYKFMGEIALQNSILMQSVSQQDLLCSNPRETRNINNSLFHNNSQRLMQESRSTLELRRGTTNAIISGSRPAMFIKQKSQDQLQSEEKVRESLFSDVQVDDLTQDKHARSPMSYEMSPKDRKQKISDRKGVDVVKINLTQSDEEDLGLDEVSQTTFKHVSRVPTSQGYYQNEGQISDRQFGKSFTGSMHDKSSFKLAEQSFPQESLSHTKFFDIDSISQHLIVNHDENEKQASQQNIMMTSSSEEEIFNSKNFEDTMTEVGDENNEYSKIEDRNPKGEQDRVNGLENTQEVEFEGTRPPNPAFQNQNLGSSGEILTIEKQEQKLNVGQVYQTINSKPKQAICDTKEGTVVTTRQSPLAGQQRHVINGVYISLLQQPLAEKGNRCTCIYQGKIVGRVDNYSMRSSDIKADDNTQIFANKWASSEAQSVMSEDRGYKEAEESQRVDLKLLTLDLQEEAQMNSVTSQQTQSNHQYFMSVADEKTPIQPAHIEQLPQCGVYCKNLTPPEQRDSIRQLLVSEQDCYHIISLSMNSGEYKDEKYLISSKWWRQWCEYVNLDDYNFGKMDDKRAESFQQEDHSEEEVSDDGSEFCFDKVKKINEEISALKSSNNPDFESQQNPQQQTLYSHPGMIKNQELIIDKVHLIDGLVENFQFVVVSNEIWRRLYSWYSADYVIKREMKRCPGISSQCYLELYPEKRLMDESNDTIYEQSNESMLGYDEDSQEESKLSQVISRAKSVERLIPMQQRYMNAYKTLDTRQMTPSGIMMDGPLFSNLKHNQKLHRKTHSLSDTLKLRSLDESHSTIKHEKQIQ